MKSIFKSFAVLVITLGTLSAFGQTNPRDLQQFRAPDQRGLNQFEALGDNGVTFDNVKVRVGGAFAIQFQSLSHSNGYSIDSLMLPELGTNFNLPTANFDIDVALADGMRMHIRTYLSSRHHAEAWVKGGYLQIDNLNFIRPGLLKGVMDIATIKVGMMEVNYGDYHFRRTDNARAIYNPFVGNLIMDAFVTEPGLEIYATPGDFLFMAGLTNGKLNQNVNTSLDPEINNGPAILAKAGWDSKVNDDLRVRLTGSFYSVSGASRNLLYFGDRAGSRFYQVGSGGDWSGRLNPVLTHEKTSIMVNPFVKFKGLEFFGTFETTSGKQSPTAETRTFSQIHGELLYRFGENENFYAGAKYNTVTGEIIGGQEITIDRIEAGAGWYMTKNVMLKATYIMQNYNDFTMPSELFEAEFSGGMLEAVISF